jgi:hypothetical protein
MDIIMSSLRDFNRFCFLVSIVMLPLRGFFYTNPNELTSISRINMTNKYLSNPEGMV